MSSAPSLVGRVMQVVLALVVAGQASAQDGPSAREDSSQADPPAASTSAPPAPPAPLAGFKLTGHAEGSYSISSRPVASAIVGRLYDRFSDQFTLNALKVAVERPVSADRLDAGVRADLLLGQNAAVVQSSGFSLGQNGDITQLFVTLNIPTANGNGVQLKAGKLVSLMGLEVIEAVANPNWSEGNQFIYVENFTNTGIEVGHRFSGLVDLQLRVSNGWDRVATTSSNKDVTARLGLAPTGSTSIGLIGFFGAHQTGNSAKRYGFQALLNQKVEATSLWIQADWGKEEANDALPDPTTAATWSAVGVWLAHDVIPSLGIALRGDYLDDSQGFRTGAAFGMTGPGEHQIWSATGTLNIRTWPSVLVRPEIRYDHSNMAPFDGESAQVTFGLSAAYLF